MHYSIVVFDSKIRVEAGSSVVYKERLYAQSQGSSIGHVLFSAKK